MIFRIVRLIWPIGAIFVVIGTFVPYVIYTGKRFEPDWLMGSYCILVYLYCSGIKVRESFGLAILVSILSFLYTLLVEETSLLDFPYSGYIFGFSCVLLILVLGALIQYSQRRKVISYFLARQTGDIESVTKFTGLPNEDVQSVLQHLLQNNKIFLLASGSSPIYSWSDRSAKFSEGMESVEMRFDDL